MPDSPYPAGPPQNVNGRYQIQEAPIGQGGMGVVYKAYDTVTKRYVALKTMWGHVDTQALELFEREWTVLARISHPNIVDILDTGEFRDNGQRKPYFVMPLLPGVTLDHLIKTSSHRLTVPRIVEIVCQACRGLQAAHDQGLVHRDLKPSNIFVMDDDAVKIIDFGVVHLADVRSATGIKGTLQYMAPEQLEMKPATALSDIFSLGVVAYEALTGRKPFAQRTEAEVIDAIRTYIPPPASEINASVNHLVSRTVHKAMAKQPWHRFSSAKEFAETLQKAIRNEPIERFDRAKIQPRIGRIKKAQAEGDYQFASEILTELESEGHIDPEMSLMKMQIEQAVRQKTIRQLLESARTRMEEDEYPLALQKIQEVLNIDRDNVDASALKAQIERQRSEKQVENWFRLVRQHLDNQDYSQARQGVQEILKIDNSDTRARELLAQIDRTQQEVIKAREEQQKLYDAALVSYKNGEITTALSKLERLLDVNRSGPKSATPDREAQYQSLYNQIRSEHDAARNAYAEGRKHLLDRNFPRVLEICQEYLQKHPADPLFQALKIETDEAQRQEQSAAVAEINRRVEAEPDLDKKYNIVKEAVDKYPQEPQFQTSLRLVKERRDLINSIAARARQYEERGQLNDASGQWDILRNVYPAFPGLDIEIRRLTRRREEQARDETKARWIDKIDRHLGEGEYTKAREAANQALEEFPEDKELQGLISLAEQGIKRSEEARAVLAEGQALLANAKYDEGLEALRKADRLDERNPVVRAALLSALLQRARNLMSRDWREAEPLVKEALVIDGSDPVARSLTSLIEDYKRQEAVAAFVLEARNLQSSGDIHAALKKVEEGLRLYPNEIRLSQLHNTLRSASEVRHRDPLPPREPADPSIQEIPPAIETMIQPGNSPASESPVREIRAMRSPPAAESIPAASPAVSQNPVAPRAAHSAPAVQPAGSPAPVTAKKIGGKGVALLAAAAVVMVAAALFFRNFERSKGTGTTTDHTQVAPGPAKPVPPTPTAAQSNLPELRITSDLKQGRLVLDDSEPVDLQEGSIAKENIPAAAHTLKIVDGKKEIFSFAFTVRPKAIVALSAPPKGSSGVVVASIGESARIYAIPGTRGGPEGQAMTPIGPEGVPVSVPIQGETRFMVADATGKEHPIAIGWSASPALNVVLSGAPERIPFSITANVPDAVVVLNGHPTRWTLADGKRLLWLAPGSYRVTLTKDDYTSPPEQPVELKSGDTKQQMLEFSLTPIVHNGTLAIESAPAGAEVLIDGKSEGTVSAAGTFTKQVSPESHSIALRKANYEPFTVTHDFKAGETEKISGDGMKSFGSVAVRIVPPSAHVTFQRNSDGKTTERASNQTYSIPAGDYTVKAEADGYSPRVETISVLPAKSTPIDWELTAIEKSRPAPLTPATVFTDGKGWTISNGWWVHELSGYTFLRASQGTFVFNILKESQKALFKNKVRKVSFVADYRDPDDRILYTLDSHSLAWKVYSGGRGAEEKKIAHGMDDRQYYVIAVEITPETVSIKNGFGTLLSSTRRAGISSKFGFLDQVSLTLR